MIKVATDQGWLDIYRQYRSLIIWYISDIFVWKYRIFLIYTIFVEFLIFFLMWHIVTVFWCQQSVCFAGLWLVPSAFSQVLDNFCQIAPLHSNAVWMTRVLHLICKAHTHTHTLYFWHFRKYHDIYKPCHWLVTLCSRLLLSTYLALGKIVKKLVSTQRVKWSWHLVHCDCCLFALYLLIYC